MQTFAAAAAWLAAEDLSKTDAVMSHFHTLCVIDIECILTRKFSAFLVTTSKSCARIVTWRIDVCMDAMPSEGSSLCHFLKYSEMLHLGSVIHGHLQFSDSAESEKVHFVDKDVLPLVLNESTITVRPGFCECRHQTLAHAIRERRKTPKHIHSRRLRPISSNCRCFALRVFEGP
jgi:hypothetical protein